METGTTILIEDKSGTYEIFKRSTIEQCRDYISNRYHNVGWENADGTKMYADVPTRGKVYFTLTSVKYTPSN